MNLCNILWSHNHGCFARFQLIIVLFLVTSSYSRSPSYSADPRRRGSVASLSSRGSYSRYSADRWTLRNVSAANDSSLEVYENKYTFTSSVIKCLLCLLPRLRDRKRTHSSRETDVKHAHKVSGKRQRRKSYSPMKKRRRDSPSHLEARRITRYSFQPGY